MNRSFKLLGCFVVLGLTSSPLAGQVSFQLGISSPATQSGNPGSTLSFGATATLTTEGLAEDADGAQGWSISISSEGCAITDVTTDGTVSADVDEGGLRDGGFDATELTGNRTEFCPDDDPTPPPDNDTRPCEGNEGAVSAVVLSFQLPITLPATGTHDVLALVVEAVVPSEEEGEGECRVFYKEDLQGSGQPVANKVTFKSSTVIPETVETTTAIQPVVDCNTPDTPLDLFFQETGSGETAVGEGGDLGDTMTVASTPGEPAVVTVFVAIRSQLEDNGVQGWSIAVGVKDGLTPTDTTIDGTLGADVDDGGFRDGGFESTEVTSNRVEGCPGEDKEPPFDRRPCENNVGAVSAVVLSFQLPITLETSGEGTVLRVDAVSDDPVPDEGSLTGTIAIQDGLQGAGQPVNNVATVNSMTTLFCAVDQQILTVTIEPVSVGAFISGDGNGDGRLDIGDPIYLINFLFRDGPAFPCEDSGDANDDGLLDLSDATFVIGYLFLGGDPPPGLDLGCVARKDSTPDTCAAGSTACVPTSG